MCIEYKSTRKTSHVTGKSDNTKEIILNKHGKHEEKLWYVFQ